MKNASNCENMWIILVLRKDRGRMNFEILGETIRDRCVCTGGAGKRPASYVRGDKISHAKTGFHIRAGGLVVKQRGIDSDDKYSQWRETFQFRGYVYPHSVDQLAEDTTNSVTDIIGVDIECQGENKIPVREIVRNDNPRERLGHNRHTSQDTCHPPGNSTCHPESTGSRPVQR